MLQITTLPVSETARLTTAVVAGLLGLMLLYVAAFARPNALHNAAHDARHALVAPCH